jgi:hypothetical protein
MATIALKASPHVSWKRTTRGGLYALGGFVALIIGFMVMRAFGIGPAGSLFAAGKLSQRDVVLVSDFNVSRADSSVASVVAEGVRANLAESRSIKLFNPTTVAAALRRMQLPPTSRLDLALARQLAVREGVKAIVTGDVTGLGNGFVIASSWLRRIRDGARRIPDDGGWSEHARERRGRTERKPRARSASHSRACKPAHRSNR